MLDLIKWNEKKMSFLQLYQVDLCRDPHLKQFHQIDRVGFMESITNYVIHPYLHQNRIKFMGVDTFGHAVFSK